MMTLGRTYLLAERIAAALGEVEVDFDALGLIVGRQRNWGHYSETRGYTTLLATETDIWIMLYDPGCQERRFGMWVSWHEPEKICVLSYAGLEARNASAEIRQRAARIDAAVDGMILLGLQNTGCAQPFLDWLRESPDA